MDASLYSVVETLRNGREIQIRALEPADRAGLLEAVAGMSPEARYRRFFAPKRDFTEKEIDYYLNVDFVEHVALVAVLDGAIVGGGRYIVSAPGRAEVAFSVDDARRSQGIGSALMRHLVFIAREAGIRELIAEVLPDNASMLKVFERSGLAMTARRDAGVVHVTLDLTRRGAGQSRIDD
ncbi:MAG: GNAT family N-acetyltransferase [Burkholderiales bacterium]|nr:GNAT family N-acetyltransferase [Burkholderiales bacterium]